MERVVAAIYRSNFNASVKSALFFSLYTWGCLEFILDYFDRRILVDRESRVHVQKFA